MKILLIAYEFPPSPSPQSLRWAYLTHRLAARGHEVHVLAPDIDGDMEGLPVPGPMVQIHRTWPGPVRALLAKLARRRPSVVTAHAGTQGRSPFQAEATGPFDVPASVAPARLNWKGRLLERFQSAISRLLFPDLRAEWKQSARKALRPLLDELKPDVVISSHEPATTLQLGLEAKRRGFRWVADLGDPVLATYTPRRWRKRASALEAAVMHQADHVVVTADQARALLRERHGTETPVTVVTQGFDEQFIGPETMSHPSDTPLELLYAGSFYSFRDPRTLVDAVLAVPGVRLNIASGNVPDWLATVARKHAGQLRLLGRIPHRRLLGLQRQAAVLVNLANADPSQVPGKFYEYLGAKRPVLHLLAGQELDAPGRLLSDLRRGWSCAGQREAISAALAQLLDAHRRGALSSGLDLDAGGVTPWCWTASAATLTDVLQDLAQKSVKNP